MDVLLRELRDGPGGAVYQDTELSGREISIGCGADQQIQLFGRGVGAKHAVLRGGGQRVSVSCFSGRRITVKGKERSSARLKIGESFEIAGHQLIVAEPPAGFDIAIELRSNAKIDSSDFEAAFRTDLSQTWVGKRWTAWLLVGATALFALVIPFAVAKIRRPDLPMVMSLPGWLTSWLPATMTARLPKLPSVPPSVPGALPAWLPADAFWSTGPLAPGHRQIIGDRCVACHQTLFTKVQDGACQDCHKVADHVEPSRLGKTSLGAVQRCADCHHEHDEPAGQLIDRTDRLCVDCHSRSPHSFGSLKVQAVTGWGTGKHPTFASVEQALTAAPAGGEMAGGRPPSGLKFSHPQHLDGAKVLRASDRKPLACADCHKMQNDGEHFEPTTMAKDCSSCHELTFDPDAPDRQLPHGKPREVVRTLQDYFARKLTDPNPPPRAIPTAARRRLPGHDEEDATCKGPAFACAMQKATAEMESQFLRRGCVSCHQVNDTKNKDLVARFEVVPIRLVNDFFPVARFPHRDHLIQDKVTGDAACMSCHPVGSSQISGDVLLPDMPTCEKCHSDKVVRDRARLQCVSCHAYHPHS